MLRDRMSEGVSRSTSVSTPRLQYYVYICVNIAPHPLDVSLGCNMAQPVRFKSLANLPSADGFRQMMYRLVGYQLERDGDDWIIPADDPVLLAGPRDSLSLEDSLNLSALSMASDARTLVSAMPSAFDDYNRDNPRRVKVEFDEDTLSNRVYAAQIALTVAQRDEVEAVLRKSVIPEMLGGMQAQGVTPVILNANYIQALQSVTKFGYLAGKFPIEDLERIIFKQRAFEGLLPRQVAPIGYVNALTRMAPLALTLPVDRMDYSLHFHGKGMWSFSDVHTHGLFHRFVWDINPVSEASNIVGLDGLEQMDGTRIVEYLKQVVAGINRVQAYFGDPRSFQDQSTGEVDFKKQLQAYGALHLFFADIQGINSSADSHSRISFAMSAIDKLANLKKSISGSTEAEGRIFGSLASLEQSEHLIKLVDQHVSATSPILGSILKKVIETTYRSLHDGLANDMPDHGKDEGHRLERLRSLRNIRHGPFLRGSSFEELFEMSRGVVPDAIATLPLILTWGFILNPEEFMLFSHETAKMGGT